jgi:hypothetical protein
VQQPGSMHLLLGVCMLWLHMDLLWEGGQPLSPLAHVLLLLLLPFSHVPYLLLANASHAHVSGHPAQHGGPMPYWLLCCHQKGGIKRQHHCRGRCCLLV